VTGRPPVNARTKVAIVELGWSTRRIAREVGVSRESARRVLRAAEASRGAGRAGAASRSPGAWCGLADLAGGRTAAHRAAEAGRADE
jgi:hypothetical protein